MMTIIDAHSSSAILNDNKRIAYIDAAKAFFMMVIVLDHTGCVEPFPLAFSCEVPAFILLSGFFFSADLPIGKFVEKKIRTILVPFVAFYVISYVLFYVGKLIYPLIANMTEAKGFTDLFTQKQLFNGPLWFLLCLFWNQLIMFGVVRNFKRQYVRLTFIMLLGVCGCLLGYYQVFLPLFFDTALSTMPFFYAGFILRKHKVFCHIDIKSTFILLFSCAIFLFVFPYAESQPSLNSWYNVFIATWVIYPIIIITVTTLCKLFRGGVMAWIGKNTLYIMCTHHLVYRPIRLVISQFVTSTDLCSCLVFVFTMLVVCSTIPFVNKYMPWIVGKFDKPIQ